MNCRLTRCRISWGSLIDESRATPSARRAIGTASIGPAPSASRSDHAGPDVYGCALCASGVRQRRAAHLSTHLNHTPTEAPAWSSAVPRTGAVLGGSAGVDSNPFRPELFR
jgi:hypothetical protein